MSSGPGATPISNLFAAEVVTAVAPTAMPGELHPAEKACVAHAAPKRVREFTAGRLIARAVLAELGIVDFPLLVGPDRAPIWPANIVGSISHARDVCGVAAARRGRVSSVGLDIEPMGPLEGELWPIVLTPDEREWLEGRASHERGGLAKLIFCAKECAYKCQSAVSGQSLEFKDVEIDFDLGEKTFTARFLCVVDKLGTDRLTGRFSYIRDHVFTGMTWLRDEAEGEV